MAMMLAVFQWARGERWGGAAHAGHAGQPGGGRHQPPLLSSLCHTSQQVTPDCQGCNLHGHQILMLFPTASYYCLTKWSFWQLEHLSLVFLHFWKIQQQVTIGLQNGHSDSWNTLHLGSGSVLGTPLCVYQCHHQFTRCHLVPVVCPVMYHHVTSLIFIIQSRPPFLA